MTLSVADCGVLLIHGFTASPSEVEPLGKVLQKLGFTISMPLLPGHGTTLNDLNQVHYADWLNTVEAELLKLSAIKKQTFVAGLSMGACLAVNLAGSPKTAGLIKAVICLAYPYWVRSVKDHRRMTLLDRLGLWGLLGKQDIPKPPSRHEMLPRFAYSAYPKKGLRELVRLVNHTRAKLSQVKQPILFVHAKTDSVAPFASLDKVKKKIPQAQFLVFDDASHVLTCDVKMHQAVIQACADFFRAVLDE